MRVVGVFAALLLLIGCDGPNNEDGAKQSPGAKNADEAERLTSTGGGFDYRYAFRLPANRLKGVLRSNADACDRMGPARCQIRTMRYHVDTANHSRAVLSIRIDPSIARKYGDAVTANVSGADGVLGDTEIHGKETSTSAQSAGVIQRLQDQLRNAQSASNSENNARAARLQSALATIAEVEASQGQTLATAPILLTYESSNGLSNLGSTDANLRNAKQMFASTASQLLTLLAGVGPWLLLMLLVVLILRWIVHGRAVGSADPEPIYASASEAYYPAPPTYPAHPADPPPAAPQPRGRASFFRRWFGGSDAG